MDPKTVLEDLEAAAAGIGLEIRYERFDNGESSMISGRYRLRGRDVLIVDRRLPMEARLAVLQKELSAFDWSGIHLRPYLRSLLNADHD